jgi:isopenicillin N synthase-like dioxygenase
MIGAGRKVDMLQIKMENEAITLARQAFRTSKDFFSLANNTHTGCNDDQSFFSYIVCGEEITDSMADYSEIFSHKRSFAV